MPELRRDIHARDAGLPTEPHRSATARVSETDAHAAPRVLTGRAAIRGAQPRLQGLADRSGQAGAADYIDYFLTQPYTGGKQPHLLLFHGGAPGAETQLEGAVLVHQYHALGVPLPVYVTEDTGGERNVLGSPETRSATALRAAEFLLRTRGAHLVLLSLQDAGFHPANPPAGRQQAPRWGLRRRTLLRRLPLLSSYEATLNTLGAHTRRNFRLFRRRALGAYGCTFVPQSNISEQDFIALNARCDYPVPLPVAQWRYRSRHTIPGGVLAGVQSAGGEWISIAGGRRYHGTFALDWQMNRTDFARISPATLMRGFLMEHEAASGTGSLLFQGGTPHSMQSAFRPEQVVDLVGSATSLPARLLLRLAERIPPRDNFLLQALAGGELEWHDGVEA